MTSHVRGIWRLLRRLPSLLRFAVYYAGQLVVANAVVAWEVLTPGSSIQPGTALVPLRSTTEGQVALLAALVSLTPGTLVLQASMDPPVLDVHGLYVPEAADLRAEVEELERRMLTALGEQPGRRRG